LNQNPIFKCAILRGSIQILEHVLKNFERITEVLVRDKVTIINMQFGLMGGKGTTDAIFIIKQLEEKYIVNIK